MPLPLPAAYRGPNRKEEEGVVRRSLIDAVVVVAALALAFTAVALTLAMNG
jgi:hypothetical protein